jgi:hypothetical protein
VQADHIIQALPLEARAAVDIAVAGITAAQQPEEMRRALSPYAAGAPAVPRMASATMTAASQVEQSALQTLAAMRANRMRDAGGSPV